MAQATPISITLETEPTDPLLFADNFKSAAFLSAPCYPVSSAPPKMKKSPNLNPKQQNNPQGEASREIPALGRRLMRTPGKPLLFFPGLFLI